ncbi:hypothetical protein EGW08_016785 [Elysia chlorotica]|uniref:HMG box domain-containing protein n=1 Tax=Elysia chlorotica TaxID=188477 RepID=A0A433T1N5_ELYCH|nr:hypothetical protein EGW08_016785 [Elysia chlorotica]
MSTRRTRRGTLLEGDAKGQKIKQNHLKNQQLLAEEVISSPQDCELLPDDLNISNSCVPDQDFKDPETSALNIEDPKLTKRNLWDCLKKDVKKKEDMSSSPPACNDVHSKVLTDMVNFGNTTVSQDAAKKPRKPEILVSLLESEAYPCVKLKSKCDEKHKNVDENKKLMNQKSRCNSQINKYREGDAFPTSASKHVCFFPYCENHSKESFKSDFLPISEVPEEPFLVSLSKDKNKELNMVTTSSGMLRVGPGCSLRRFLPTSSCSKQPPGELNCGDVTDSENKKEIKENKKLSSLLPELSKGTSPSVCVSQVAQPVAHWRELITRDDTGSCANSIEKSVPEADRSLLAQGFEKMIGEFVDNKDDIGSTKSTSAQSPESNSVGTFSQEQESGYFSDFVVSEDSVPLKSCKTNLFPFIEDSSPDTNSQALATAAPNSQKSTNDNENCRKIGKETISLLKTGTQSSLKSSLQANDTLGACSSFDTRKTIKRSERIRCKSKLPMDAKVKLEKYVALNQVFNLKKAKTKLKCSDRIIPKIKTSFKKKSLQKMTTMSSKTKKGLAIKAKKNYKKKKIQMTRRVMDGIVQSIEETVLKAAQDESFEEAQKNVQMITEDSSETLSNQEPGLSAGVSYFEGLSNSVLPLIMDKNASVEQNTLALPDIGSVPHLNKNKMMKLHKNKEKVKFKKTDSGTFDFHGMDVAVGSKHKRSKAKMQAGTNSNEQEVTKSEDPVYKMETLEIESLHDSNSSSSVSTIRPTSKRSRKKTKKAEEAFDDIGLAVFWEDNQPTKRSKSKKRINVCESESSNGGTKRPRRNSQLGELMADPVLKQHAFILWASENRSQVEMQNPSASACEVDAILSSRWCDVLNSVKGRFFFRAREALSDDDRHSLQTGSSVGNFELDPKAGHEEHQDQDPLFIEFMGLSVDKQRDMLRKWLKFFQKMLPKKEYIDFILTFKNACGESDALMAEPGKPVKRPRMRCLDPAHYRMLFDMIRLTRPRIIEVCKEKKGKEKKIVSQTYSMIVHKLVCGEPWPEVSINSCQSQTLTQILLDLNIHCSSSTLDSFASKAVKVPFPDVSKSSIVNNTLTDMISTIAEVNCEIPATTMITFGPGECTWSDTQVHDPHLQRVEHKLFVFF